MYDYLIFSLLFVYYKYNFTLGVKQTVKHLKEKSNILSIFSMH